MNGKMAQEFLKNPSRNPLTGKTINPSGRLAQTLLKQSMAVQDNAKIRQLVDTWMHYSIETPVDIILEPIPKNVVEVLKLADKEKAMVEAKQALKKNALYIRLDEEDATIHYYLDVGEYDMPKNIIYAKAAKDAEEPWRRGDPKELLKLAEDFINTIKKLIKPNMADIKIRLEAVPSDRSADEFGKTVLRDVYGELLVYFGLEHKNIRINEYTYDADEDEYYKKSIPFRSKP